MTITRSYKPSYTTSLTKSAATCIHNSYICERIREAPVSVMTWNQPFTSILPTLSQVYLFAAFARHMRHSSLRFYRILALLVLSSKTPSNYTSSTYYSFVILSSHNMSAMTWNYFLEHRNAQTTFDSLTLAPLYATLHIPVFRNKRQQ